MSIVFRDEIGYLAVRLSNDMPIDFCDGKVYFTDADENDYIISVENLIRIVEEK